MNVSDSLENAIDQNKSKFENELIERFFDHKSYYLNGFMSHLRKNETTLENPLDMVAVGLFVDEIINASNKIEKLDQLKKFDQFNFYRQQLSEGIKYLESSKLSTQQMMDIVGSLGKSFAETLVNLVAQQDSRKYLLNLVGLNEGAKKSESNPKRISAVTPVIKQKPVNHKKRSKHGEPWDYFKKDVNGKITAVKDLLNRLEKNPDCWETFKQIKNAYKDLRDWSMIQGDQGIEAISHKILLLFEAVFVRDSEKRSIIFPVLHDAIDIIQTINNSGPGSEGLDVVRVQVHQIDKQRMTYPEDVVAQNSEDSSSSIQEKTDKNTLEALPEANNIEEKVTNFEHQNDEESYSELAEKTEEALIEDEVSSESQENFMETLEEEEVKEENKQEDTIDSFDQEFSEYLNDFNAHRNELNEEKDPEIISLQENTIEEKETEDLNEFDSIRDSEMLSELVIDNTDRLDEIDFPELEEVDHSVSDISHSEKEEIHELTLPGEDDQDLINLISEIQTENNEQENHTFDSEFSEVLQDSDNKDDVQTNRINQNSRNQTKITGTGGDFVEEADMYFSFAKKALQNLMKNSSDKQALEDMELACYSLKTIGDKLGYSQVGKMMDYAENFIQKRIVGETKLKTDQINTLFSIVDELEKAGNEKSYTSPDRKKWFSNQELTLKNWMSPHPNPSKKNVQTPFQNRNKKSTFRQDQSEDPLDFLLFDDTSKYFKQLLKD